MLILSLVVSLVVLGVVNSLVHARKANFAFIACFVSIFCSVLSTPVIIQAALTLPLFVLLLEGRRSIFTVASIVAMIASYVYPIHEVIKEEQRLAAARNRFPFISLDDRLPPAPKKDPKQSYSNGSTLSKLESEIEVLGTNASPLKTLHEDRVNQFVNSPGFGSGRMIRTGTYGIEERFSPDPIYQPSRRVRSEGDVGEPFDSRSLEDGLLSLHLLGVIDFVNPRGFGYVRSRREVAGFRPHRFSEVPKDKIGWAVDSIELVGVLVHSAPMVYVSEYLPRMDQLSKASTRPLVDAFETAGLADLTAGQDLHVRSVHDGARMMGAIRNAKQCLECHQGQRGDLLGAFSYHLRRTD